jgi:hypothetical protein
MLSSRLTPAVRFAIGLAARDARLKFLQLSRPQHAVIAQIEQQPKIEKK